MVYGHFHSKGETFDLLGQKITNCINLHIFTLYLKKNLTFRFFRSEMARSHASLAGLPPVYYLMMFDVLFHEKKMNK